MYAWNPSTEAEVEVHEFQVSLRHTEKSCMRSIKTRVVCVGGWGAVGYMTKNLNIQIYSQFLHVCHVSYLRTLYNEVTHEILNFN